jgi:hypothetical protein
VIAWLAWMSVLFSGPAGPMDLVALKVAGRVVTVVPADVNGDEQQDVLVFWRQGLPPKARSRVSVFLSKNGRVNPKPIQVLLLPAETVAFDVGDVGSDKRADVLWLSRDGIWAHEGKPDGRLAQKPRQVIEVMTVAAFPHEDHIPRMPLLTDLGRGRKGLLIPTVPIGPLTLYEYSRKKGWFLRQVMRVPARANLHTSAEDFRSARDYGVLFQLTFPRFEVADQNGDELKDFLFFSQDSVAVFHGREDLSFPPEPDLYRSFGLIEPRERTKRGLFVRGGAGDVNGDGKVDLFFNKTVGGISNMKCEMRIYLADSEGRYSRTPVFSSKREGWGLSARLLDVNGDGRADLLRPHVEMGITTLIKAMLASKLDVDFEVYLSRASGLPKRPDFAVHSALGINFKSAQELHGTSPIFSEDFNGDTILDLVMGDAGEGSGDNPDLLMIRAGRRGKEYSEDPVFSLEFPGTRFVVPFRIRAQDLPGLLIYFSMVEKLRGDVWVLHNIGPWR